MTFTSFAHKDLNDDSEHLPSLPAYPPIQWQEDGTWKFPLADEDEFEYFDKDFGRIFPLEALEDYEAYGMPFTRLVVSGDVLAENSAYGTYTAGMFNTTGWFGPVMTRWANGCGYNSATGYDKQVSSFISGSVTGMPDCDIVEDSFHADEDTYTGFPTGGLNTHREHAAIFGNVGENPGLAGAIVGGENPWATPGTNEYSLIPWLRHGISPGEHDPVFCFIVYEFTYGTMINFSAASGAFMLIGIIGAVLCFLSCIGVAVTK